MPVTRISNQPVANGQAGPLTLQLQTQYWKKREQGWHGTRIDEILESAVLKASTA